MNWENVNLKPWEVLLLLTMLGGVTFMFWVWIANGARFAIGLLIWEVEAYGVARVLVSTMAGGTQHEFYCRIGTPYSNVLFTGSFFSWNGWILMSCYWPHVCVDVAFVLPIRFTIFRCHLLQEAPCGDFVTHFFCHLCAICQEYREICERSGDSNPPDLNLVAVTAPPAQTMESAST